MTKAKWFEGSIGLAAVVVTLAVAGCGGGSSSSGDLCVQAAQASCDKIFTCAEGEPARESAGGTKEKCLTDMCPAGGGTCPSGTTYHPDKAQQCVDQTKNATCAASFDSDGFLNSPSPCFEVCS
jgi:hypothetical protein